MGFQADIDRIVAKAKVALDDVVKETCRLAVEGAMTAGTWSGNGRPVGNPDAWKYPAPPGYEPGTFMANWNASLNAPNESMNLAAKDDSGAATHAAANAVIDGMKIGENFYFTNSVPYAARLEYEGWSWTQAPAGMVRVTVAGIGQRVEAYIASKQ